MDAIAYIAEQRIAAAMADGDFDNLPGKGKPLPPSEFSDVPAELRLGYKLLKNAGMVPEEIALQQKIRQLKSLLSHCPPPEKEALIRQTLRDSILHYDILMEKRRHSPFL